jgi:hypothetical protein
MYLHFLQDDRQAIPIRPRILKALGITYNAAAILQQAVYWHRPDHYFNITNKEFCNFLGLSRESFETARDKVAIKVDDLNQEVSETTLIVYVNKGRNGCDWLLKVDNYENTLKSIYSRFIDINQALPNYKPIKEIKKPESKDKTFARVGINHVSRSDLFELLKNGIPSRLETSAMQRKRKPDELVNGFIEYQPLRHWSSSDDALRHFGRWLMKAPRDFDKVKPNSKEFNKVVHDWTKDRRYQ